MPPLSKLRRAEGKPAYGSGIVAQVRELIASGELPLGDYCARCCAGTSNTVDVLLELECPTAGGPGLLLEALSLILMIKYGKYTFERMQRPSQGCEVLVRVRLRLCRNCRVVIDGTLRMRHRRRLRRWLQATPLYAQLFREYADARIVGIE